MIRFSPIMLSLCLTVSLGPVATAQHSLEIFTGVVPGSNQTMSAWGTASASDGEGYPVGVSGALALYEGFAQSWETVNSLQFFEPEGTWEESNLSATAAEGLCYNSGLRAKTSLADRTVYGAEECVPSKPVLPRDPILIADGACDPDPCQTSPVILNLHHASYQFGDPALGPLFDLNADGRQVNVSWPRDPASMGFLYLDRNGNGSLDDGSELFGDRTRLIDGTLAKHGFEALSELDSDFDGAITPLDHQWRDLRVWLDVDADGVPNSAELRALDDVGVTALWIAPIWSGQRDQYGNRLQWRSYFDCRNGQGCRQPYYDVFLTYVVPAS